MNKKNILFLVFPVISLILEALPFGVVLNFANPEGKPWRRTFSYFDLTPFGYAVFPPFIVAILTCVIIVLTSIYIAKQSKGLFNAIAATSAAALGLSLVQFMYGLHFVTAITVLVPILLLLHVCFFMWKGKPQ